MRRGSGEGRAVEDLAAGAAPASRDADRIVLQRWKSAGLAACWQLAGHHADSANAASASASGRSRLASSQASGGARSHVVGRLPRSPISSVSWRRRRQRQLALQELGSASHSASLFARQLDVDALDAVGVLAHARQRITTSSLILKALVWREMAAVRERSSQNFLRARG
jgi:hypothetical protein